MAVRGFSRRKLAAQYRDHLSRSPINRRDANIRRRKAARNFRHCLRGPSRKPVGPDRSIGRRRRRSRERRMRPNVHGQEHHGNVIGRARAADVSTANRAGRRSHGIGTRAARGAIRFTIADTGPPTTRSANRSTFRMAIDCRDAETRSIRQTMTVTLVSRTAIRIHFGKVIRISIHISPANRTTLIRSGW